MGESDRRDQILHAALSAFSTYGVAKTTMADIASSSGLSRPGLYQYFDDKEDILVALVVRVIGDAAERAIDALTADAPLESRVEGLLQHWWGDLYAELRNSAHGIDLVEIKSGRAKPALDDISARVRAAALEALEDDAAVDVVLMAPVGFKADLPDVDTYRARLSSLAAMVAGSIDRTGG